MFVMPSVKRTNSILFPGPSQSGLRARMRRRADAWEFAGEYEREMYRRAGAVPLTISEEPMVGVEGKEGAVAARRQQHRLSS